MIRRRLLVIAALTLPMLYGCATMHDWHSHRRAARYCRKHPERPTDILVAVQSRRVCQGMTPAEVALCLGEPRAVTEAEAADIGVTWHYDEVSAERNGLRGSAMWDLRIPTWRIDFGTSTTVTNIVRYHADGRIDDLPRPDAAPASVPPPTPARTARTSPPTIPAAPRPRTDPTRVEPINADFRNWPSLTLNGVSAMSGQATAIVNGELVEVGDRIEDVRVLKIGVNGILLDYRGANGFLTPGASTRDPR